MRLTTAREAQYTASAKAGDVGRQLALGGIAVVWLLHGEPKSLVFPLALLQALGAFLLALSIDFCQYWVTATIWAIYSRRKELFFKAKNVDANDEKEPITNFKAPKQLNWPAMVFFHAKAVALLVGGWKLGWYLWEKLSMAPM